MEHERKDWFQDRKAKAIWNVFHDSWNNFINGIEDEVVNVDPMFEFLQNEKDNWGLVVEDSDEEMIVGAAKDSKFLNRCHWPLHRNLGVQG